MNRSLPADMQHFIDLALIQSLNITIEQCQLKTPAFITISIYKILSINSIYKKTYRNICVVSFQPNSHSR